jgi:hypothetical protein
MSANKPGIAMGPPWVIFCDDGAPIAILAAGRPGEVANVEGVPSKTVEAIVRAANSGDDFHSRRLADLSERVLARADKLESMEVAWLTSPETVERAAKAMYEAESELRDELEPGEGSFTWDQLYEEDRDKWRRRAQVALAAALVWSCPIMRHV